MRRFDNFLGRSLKATLLASAVLFPIVSEAQAISLKDAVEHAVSSNPDIGIVASNREAVDQELRQARGLYLPQIDIAAGLGVENLNDRTTRLNGGDSSTQQRGESSITLQQRIFDGFDADNTVAREKARVESAAQRVQENSEFLALDVVGAYLEVLRQRELVDLAEINLQAHLGIISKLQERQDAGSGSSADVSQTNARAARARATLTQTYNDLRNAEANYTRIVGEFPNDLSAPTLPADALPVDLTAALELAVKNNPTTKIFEADVRTANAEVGISEANFYPRLSLEAESEYNDGTDSFDTYEFNNQVMLRVRWNLFRGGIDRAARQEALSRVSESKNRRFRSVVEVEREMRQSWFALEANRQAVSDFSSAVEFNVETRDAYRDQFEVAQRTLLDVLDAENELFVSQGQLVSAMTNEELAAYRVIALSGELLATLGVAAPEQARVEHKSWAEGMLD
jgi:adhesin transport system outer membrane protein